MIDATLGITDLVEAMHRNIARVPLVTTSKSDGRTRGLTGLIYGAVRGVTRGVGGGLDAAIALAEPALTRLPNAPAREAVLSALNGVFGDHLAASGNPLAIQMSVRQGGESLTLQRESLAAQLPHATGKILLLVHGLCMNDLQWNHDADRESNVAAHDHGSALQRDAGVTAVYLHYNSGRHISTNGREFASLLKSFVAAWPVAVESIVFVAHSMGGLVTRSAFHYGRKARHTWCKHVTKMIFLGTPHQGAPLERGGHWIDLILGAAPYASPFAKLGKARSAGITDLRHGSLLDEDWQDTDEPTIHMLPLPKSVRCYAIAATIATNDEPKKRITSAKLIGDGLVPVASALGQHTDRKRALHFAANRQSVLQGINHMDLLKAKWVYPVVREFVAE